MNKKYELTDETMEYMAIVLHRIRLLRPIGLHKAGELGGYIESEDNLSQEGDCMVYDRAMVYDNARVYDNAKVYEYAEVQGDARVYGHANVHGTSRIISNARVYGYADIHGGTVKGMVHGYASLRGTPYIGSMVEVYRYACIRGDAIIMGKVKIQYTEEYYIVKDYPSGIDYTWTKPNNMWNSIGFHGTPEEFIKKGYESSEEDGKMFELMVRFVKDMQKIYRNA